MHILGNGDWLTRTGKSAQSLAGQGIWRILVLRFNRTAQKAVRQNCGIELKPDAYFPSTSLAIVANCILEVPSYILPILASRQYFSTG